MTFALASQFHVYLPWVDARLAWCLNSVLGVGALVGAFNQERALVGAFSVIVQLHRLVDLRHYLFPFSEENLRSVVPPGQRALLPRGVSPAAGAGQGRRDGRGARAEERRQPRGAEEAAGAVP